MSPSGATPQAVIAAPLSDRLSLLTAGLDAAHWRVLGALALEQGLSRGVLVALTGSGSDSRTLDVWLKHALSSGLLQAAGPTRVLGLSGAPSREPGYALGPELGQLVLRELARRDALAEIARATHELLGARSVAELSLRLVSGDYRGFARSFVAERLPRQIALRTAADWLRVAVCEPFDAAWLEATWGQQAPAVATRVLREALEGPSPCAPVLDWLTQRAQVLEPGDERSALAGLLCEHALLRGATGPVQVWSAHLSQASALGYGAVASFLEGDVPGAQARLDAAFGLVPGRSADLTHRRGPLPQCGSVAPVLALLLCGRGEPGALALAKRLLSVGTSEGERGAARAFRSLLRRLDEPEIERERLDVHDLSSGASAWETLIMAYDVALHQQQIETRARWAQHLVRRAVGWHAAGYRFVVEQALRLAAELQREYAEQELSRQAVGGLSLAGPGLSLWDLVTPRPEWQKTLQALSAVTAEVEQETEASLRVAWFVDMADGSLSRPALQERRVAHGGWSQGRRLSFSELYELRERLPLEDQRVLEATRELTQGRREAAPEAYERLIGHPRVMNGARPGLRVEVVAGSCRIETREEPGYLQVLVEPAGAQPGVNVRPEGEARLVVFRVSDSMQRVIEVVQRGLRVPLGQKHELLDVLGKLSQSVEVQSAELGVEVEVEADATACLRFAPHAGAWLVQAGVRPFGSKGRFFVAGSGRVALGFSSGGQRLRCERDFERERASVDRLVAACATLKQAPEEQGGRPAHEIDNWVLGEEGVLCLLSELRVCGVAHELEWPESGGWRLRGDARSSLQAQLRVNKGWYLATGGLRLDDINEVTLSQLVHAPALCGGRFVRLASGDYVELESRLRRVIAALSAAAARRKPGAELRIHAGALAALSELSEGGLELDAAATSWLERVRRVDAEEVAVPAGLVGELRPYQLEGYRWLCRLSELGLGACLADDMGLGKTVQILSLLLRRAEQGPQLVVAPTSVCANWLKEARRFAPSLQALDYFSSDRNGVLAALRDGGAGKLLVCSYQLLQQDQAKLAEIEWGTAVLDEAQFIKNSQSLRAQAAFRIDAKQRIAATGTPVENHSADLWSIFNFLNPGLLGDHADFIRRFVKPIDREGGPAPEELLRRVIQPYVLRRLKRDVLKELPPLTELQHEVELSSDEALRYALLRRQIHDKLFTGHGKRENKLEVLAEITRLRRFCCHPRLVFPDADRESAKVQAFLALVEELRENGHRALVFSQFVDFLDIVREELDERRISYEYLDGSTPQVQRQQRVDAFQGGSASLFLISLKAGGFGLNLTAADYVIHLDPWWNPAVEAQATDRAHRIGQDKRVTVYRLITKQSIEEKIVELHGKKRALARSLLDGTAQAATLSGEELLELLQSASAG